MNVSEQLGLLAPVEPWDDEGSAALATSAVTRLLVPSAGMAAMLPTGSVSTTYHWNQSQSLGTPAALSHHFSDAAPIYSESNSGYAAASAQTSSAAQQATSEQMLAAYAKVAGLSFTPMGSEGADTLTRVQLLQSSGTTQALGQSLTDFNGDGLSDLLWRNSTYVSSLLWYSGNPNTTEVLTPVADPNWQIVGLGDFNADGRRRAGSLKRGHGGYALP